MNNAVGSQRVSTTVGYIIGTGDFRLDTPNLPQRVAILGAAAEAKSPFFTENEPVQINSAQQAGENWGFGSQIHMAARILFPQQGDGIGAIPVIVYPQFGADGEHVLSITPVGNATKTVVHTLVVAGRRSLDGISYNFTVNLGDTPIIVAQTISDTLNAVLNSPFGGAINTPGIADATAKTFNKAANDLTLSIDINGDGGGVSYGIVNTNVGTGVPAITPALELFGNEWNTLVINCYGTETSILDELEAFNGLPDPENPTGRFQGIVMKPFAALTGSVADNDTVLTDARKNDVTIALCPAPLSLAHPLEAAACMAILEARVAQDTPHLDVQNKTYSDMPAPIDIGTMKDYNNRDAYVKLGNSTVDLFAGKYRVKDFVSTYHPDGETTPQFRYVRNLMIDFNVRYGYLLLEEANVVDHAIAGDDDPVKVDKVIKPKQLIALINTYAIDLAERALITEPSFMQDSITVERGGDNPDRLDTEFKYKRSPFARIAATVGVAGFSFGG